MTKFTRRIVTLILAVFTALSASIISGCSKSNEKTITVCASATPHAEVLNGIVASELKKKGYTLKVEVLDWTLQNDSVANGEYDANYFQHVPYLETYSGKTKLFAACKVHYEPLGIYYGKARKGTDVKEGKTFEICNDLSNAIRAFALLEDKGVISRAIEGDNFPIDEGHTALNINKAEGSWTSKDGSITVTLIEEDLLVSVKGDYDFALLPCNTALTGHISDSERADKETNENLVVANANVIAARENDYKTDEKYRAKIDALTDVMLSSAVSEYFKTKYNGIIVCDDATQIDLRTAK